MAYYSLEITLETPEEIPNLILKVQGRRLFYTNRIYIEENEYYGDARYTVYKNNSTILQGNQVIRKYKEIGTVEYSDKQLQSINNCKIITDDYRCSKDVFEEIFITSKGGKYYLVTGYSQCIELTTQTPEEIAKVKEITDLVENEDEMSPAIKFNDRCKNIR